MPIAVRVAAAQLACPYLGLVNDPATRCTFPSFDHRCQRPVRATRVRTDHQSAVCLTPAHTACPVFAGTAPLPPAEPGSDRRRLLLPGGVALMVGAAGLLMVRMLLTEAPARATTTLPAPAPPPAAQATGTAVPATAVSPSRTATTVRYRVREGDTLTAVAAFYGSRPEDVIRLNGLPDDGAIYAGQELTLPIGP